MMGRICRAACGRGKSEVIDGRLVSQGALLADGGFAYVYRGSDLRSGEDIAIRRALLQDGEARQAARDEIAILESLPPHEHVVRFLGAEIVGSGPVEAVSLWELCPGGTLVVQLQAAMDAAGPSSMDAAGTCCPCLPEADVFKVLGGTAAALAHLHQSSIIHYDVKSENLMLGADRRWKLGDFGSASRKTFDLAGASRPRVLEAEEFVSGRCTPMYRAPEVADLYLRWCIGPKVDIFALGCVLFACVAGTHPFPQDSQLANVQAKFRLPRQMPDAYSRALATWVSRLLAREPAERPAAADLVSEVRDYRQSRREPPDISACLSSGDRERAPASSPAELRARAGAAAAPPSSDWKADFSFAAVSTDTGHDR